jgi:hypothetical protein
MSFKLRDFLGDGGTREAARSSLVTLLSGGNNGAGDGDADEDEGVAYMNSLPLEVLEQILLEGPYLNPEVLSISRELRARIVDVTNRPNFWEKLSRHCFPGVTRLAFDSAFYLHTARRYGGDPDSVEAQNAAWRAHFKRLVQLFTRATWHLNLNIDYDATASPPTDVFPGAVYQRSWVANIEHEGRLRAVRAKTINYHYVRPIYVHPERLSCGMFTHQLGLIKTFNLRVWAYERVHIYSMSVESGGYRIFMAMDSAADEVFALDEARDDVNFARFELHVTPRAIDDAYLEQLVKRGMVVTPPPAGPYYMYRVFLRRLIGTGDVLPMGGFRGDQTLGDIMRSILPRVNYAATGKFFFVFYLGDEDDDSKVVRFKYSPYEAQPLDRIYLANLNLTKNQAIFVASVLF